MFFDLNQPGGRLFGIFLGHLGYLGQKNKPETCGWGCILAGEVTF